MLSSLVSGLFPVVPFLLFPIDEWCPGLLATFSLIFPESEILRVKAWVYTAPLWLHCPRTTALVLEEPPRTLPSHLPCCLHSFPESSAFSCSCRHPVQFYQDDCKFLTPGHGEHSYCSSGPEQAPPGMRAVETALIPLHDPTRVPNSMLRP